MSGNGGTVSNNTFEEEERDGFYFFPPSRGCLLLLSILSKNSLKHLKIFSKINQYVICYSLNRQVRIRTV
jgi:hypothetical protein